MSTTSIAYNQGVSFDQARRSFFFDGVSSATNSGLYRTDSTLGQMAANLAVIPPTAEGYNHAGDLTYDPVGGRVLLPLECYYPAAGGNTCGVGAIEVADPVSLRSLYYVDLDTRQIRKAMWAEISPDGRWIWTSSGTHLLVYRAADVNRKAAERQRSGALRGLVGKDLGPVLPGSGVTGAAFYEDVWTRAPRLLLALNRGTYSEVVSYVTGTGRDGSPKVLDRVPRVQIKLAQSSSDHESEGLAVTGAGMPVNPLGGVLDWLMLPVITPSRIFSRVLSYLPVPPPPLNGASLPRRQRLETALRGLRLTLVCNTRCTSTASATIDGRLARRLRLVSPNARLTRHVVGTGALPAGVGRRTLEVTFRSRARTALATLARVKIEVSGRSTDPYSHRRSSYQLTTTLNR